MVWSYYHHQSENILLSKTTQLTTDPFYKISNITVIVYYILLCVVCSYVHVHVAM
jgi:hypothetical protein